ncbi:MAG: HAMP domain-containing histidine kinase [Myxococcales bacterium]|nr:HAMP domain-containing histidine kinase [Myxococcales bacterium]
MSAASGDRYALGRLSSEFVDPANERAFLEATYGQRRRLSIVTCIVGVVGFLATIGLDLTDFKGTDWLVVAVSMRLGTAATLVLAAGWFWRQRGYRPATDVIVGVIHVIVGVAFLVASSPLRDRALYLLPTFLVLVLVGYLFLPTRGRFSAPVAIVLSGVFLGLIGAGAAPTEEKGLTVMLVLAINVLGVGFSRPMNRTRRREFIKTRALEAAIARRDKAEAAAAASRARSRFFMNVSHELRTPIHGIIGYIDLIEEEAEERGVDPATLADLGKIRLSSARLERTLGKILELSSLEVGHSDVTLTRVDPGAFLRELAREYIGRARERDNTITTRCLSGTPHVETDASLLRQCMEPLVDNAARFTECGDIELAAAPIYGEEGDLWVMFSVEDSGVGIAQELQSGLFDPFTRADESSSDQSPRTGVSLAVTRRLCALLGGDVDFETVVGSGTRFTIRLPAAAPTRLRALVRG